LFFVAGRNLSDISCWVNQRFPAMPYFYEDDFSLYDSTFNIKAQTLVQWLYSLAGSDFDPWFASVRRAQTTVQGVGREGWRYTVEATMKSGQADTCLANTIVNLLGHLFAIWLLNGRPPLHSLLSCVAMAGLGDDNVMATSYTNMDLAPVLLKLGFIAKLKRCGCINDLVFLNNRFYPMDDGSVWLGPKIGRILARSGTAIDIQRLPYVYLRGNALGLAATVQHVPILREFVQHTVLLTSGHSDDY
jgi:hypothetical protein